MRIRRVLATAAVGAALLTGGTTAVAQAAPASVDTNTTASAPSGVFDLILVGTYRTAAACEADGESSAYAFWVCEWNGSRWELWVDDDT